MTEVSIGSPREARREERQDFSIHNFSQLLTKPPALQAPGSPELEDSRQPARAFCSIPRLSARKLSLPDDSEQTVDASFSSTQRTDLFLCSPSLQIKQKTKTKGKQKPKDRWIKGQHAQTRAQLPWAQKAASCKSNRTQTRSCSPLCSSLSRLVQESGGREESTEGPMAAHLFSDNYKGGAQELKSSTPALCPNPATLQVSALRCVYSREYSSINSPIPFLTFSPVNCWHTPPCSLLKVYKTD